MITFVVIMTDLLSMLTTTLYEGGYYMSLELINKTNIVDDLLNNFIIEKIGDAKNNVFIEGSCLETLYEFELMPGVTKNLGEQEVDGVKVIKKLGLVYLNNENLNFVDKNNQIFSLVPSLKYSKNDTYIETLEHIEIYNQYSLIVKDNNKYKLIVVTYSEVL